MKRDTERVIRDEAEVYEVLSRLRNGRKVSVTFTQAPFATVCTMSGRWVPRALPDRVGWSVMGPSRMLAIILPTDRITVLCVPGRIHLMVSLAGRRIPGSAAFMRRAEIAGGEA